MSSLTSALIAIPTLLNIAAALWLLWWTSRSRGEEKRAQTTGHIWDGDLTEYNKPLPRWWLGLFVLTVLFGLGYLVLYPGLGNFLGIRKWSQVEQFEAESRDAELVLQRALAPFAKQPVAALVHDPEAIRTGRNFFLNNCAACHGADARGAPGFPNLTDKDWLWGGSAETVLATIQNGRTGVMPGWLPIVGGERLENLLTYVMSLSGRKLPAGNAEEGKQTFGQLCAACHGAGGQGNPLLGAPNLTDNVWLHGGAVATIRATIANGRQGQMPAHLERLGEVRTKLVAAYVLSLGGGAASASASVASATPTPAQ
ncbi:MAG: cytochrome-c oxidase, cbb3-type subunit III [Gammaproteobacteria bacterium]